MLRRTLPGVMTAVILTLLAGCGDRAGVGMDSASASPPAGDPAVSLVRTGGFAGVHDQAVIAPDGAWTATDRAGTQRSGRLTDAQRDALRRLAADPRLAREAARTQGPTRCADVYEYDLTVDAVRVHFIDCPTDPDRPAAAAAVVTWVARTVWR
jgi:hypothetical protein